jgi:predicted alpha/beta-fold hydrolase
VETASGPAELLTCAGAWLSRHPFVPARWLRNPHLQTIAAARRHRRFPWGWRQDRGVLRRLSDGSQVELRWVEAGPEAPVLVLLHGMSGSARSGTVLALSHKAWRCGWSSLRIDLYDRAVRHAPPRILHAGASSVLREVVELENLGRRPGGFALAGVSMGGNLLLKALGEWGQDPPAGLTGAAVISPLLDLSMSWHLLEEPRNRIYQWYYVGRLKRLIQQRGEAMGCWVDLERLRRVRTILEFDAVVTAPLSGYRDVFHYYEDAGARRWLGAIRIPVLLLHARDDPFLPWIPLTGRDVRNNPFLLPWLTDRGGHAAFLEKHPSGMDRSWAENRVVDFLCQAAGGVPGNVSRVPHPDSRQLERLVRSIRV